MKTIKILLIFTVYFFIWIHAQADTATWQAPIVYNLNLAGQNIYESERILTAGVITSITVNWNSSGKVLVEVSANGGKDYTPIVNGVPLNNGFIPGDRLRFKAFLDSGSYLSKVSIFYTDTSGLRYTFGNPQLSHFKFRKPINIINEGEAELFNYQIQIKVGERTSRLTVQADVYCEEKIMADFRDIRFTSADGETTLAHYLESIEGVKPNRIATFLVKIPQLPKGESPLRIYLYYGNKDAQNLSSAEDVFDFYDDFNEKELDFNKWEVFNDLKGETGIENSELKLKSTKVLSRSFRLHDGIIEFKAKIQGHSAIQAIIRERKQISSHASISQTAYSSSFPGAEHTIAVGDMVRANIGNSILENEVYIYRITAEGLNLNFERYNAKSNNKEAELHFKDIGGLRNGYIGIRGESAIGNENAVYLSWIRIRKCAKVLPRVLFIGQEEKIDMFGQFTLKEGENLSRYESLIVPIGYIAHIMVIDSDLPLEISLDGGRTYSQYTRNKKYYYYSSLGDFRAGGQLKWKKEGMLPRNQVTITYYPGTVTLISPNGGEKIICGALTEIIWSAREYESKYLLKLEYSLDKGRTYKTIVDQTPNTGSFYWRIPEGALSNQGGLVKISDSNAKEVYDVSDGFFSIISN